MRLLEVVACLALWNASELVSPWRGQVNNGRMTASHRRTASSSDTTAGSPCLAYRCDHLLFKLQLLDDNSLHPYAWDECLYCTVQGTGEPMGNTAGNHHKQIEPGQGPTQAGQMRRARSRQRPDGFFSSSCSSLAF
ncbi:hypothetical protein V8C42DRAFT_311745 [Trichoderma barbatum]